MSEEEAAAQYLKRKARNLHPYGQTDGKGRWYPTEMEKADCCDNVRQPSRSYPWSLMTHCRSLKHICTRAGLEEAKVKYALSKKGLPLLLGLNDPWVNNYVATKLKGE